MICLTMAWYVINDLFQMAVLLNNGEIPESRRHNMDIHWFLFSESPTKTSLLLVSFFNNAFALNLKTSITGIINKETSIKDSNRKKRKWKKPWKVTITRLPSPVLILEVFSAILLTRKITNHERTFLLFVQRTRFVVINPFPWKQIAALKWIVNYSLSF